MFQDKAQTAKNGPVLLKGCNTVLGHLPQRNGLILEALRVKYANLCQVMAQIVARKPACKVSRDAGTGKRISAKV